MEKELMPPLALAYVGDAVFELFIREKTVADGAARTSDLHKRSVGFCSAVGQADCYYRIEHMLSEHEMTIFKRGRNAKPPHSPKNAPVRCYRVATGFETLLGHLYLSGKTERLNELMEASILLNQG